MKHFLLSLLSLFALFVAGVAVAGGWAVKNYMSAGPLQESKLVLIERGQGVSAIAQKLEQEQIIAEPMLFKIAGRFGDSLKAGEYEFPANVSMAEVMQLMREGKVFDRKITIPEGLNELSDCKIIECP